jgi:hypothetical protein
MVNISEIFRSYHAKSILNEISQSKAQKGAKTFSLSQQDFILANGPPPWELMDSIIKRVRGFEYTITHPVSNEPHQDFKAQIVRRDDGMPINPEHLSSGEKILLRVALSIYSNWVSITVRFSLALAAWLR